VELPWDFVRHYCDRNYRPRMEMIAAEGRQVLGTRVRALREAAGLTQESLARAAGIGRVTLVRLESGKHTPKISTLAAIAQILERPVEDLFAGPDESG
jgi:putative transcriptional regulator